MASGMPAGGGFTVSPFAKEDQTQVPGLSREHQKIAMEVDAYKRGQMQQQQTWKRYDPTMLPPEKDVHWRVKHKEDETTLADVRQAQKREKREKFHEGDKAIQARKKINITNYTTEDSSVKVKSLHTYYCSICGTYCLIIQEMLSGLPVRRTDSAYCVSEKEYLKRNVAYAEESTKIRRSNGVEQQYRIYCKECKQPLGYRSGGEKEESPYTYFWVEALVQSQLRSIAFKRKRYNVDGPEQNVVGAIANPMAGESGASASASASAPKAIANASASARGAKGEGSSEAAPR